MHISLIVLRMLNVAEYSLFKSRIGCFVSAADMERRMILENNRPDEKTVGVFVFIIIGARSPDHSFPGVDGSLPSRAEFFSALPQPVPVLGSEPVCL